MISLRQVIKLVAALGAILALTGCTPSLFPGSGVQSEEPLFDARTGRAKPFAPGAYEICWFSEGTSGECWEVLASRDDTRAYRFVFTLGEEKAVHEFRFRRLAKDAWVLQAQRELENGLANPGYFLVGRQEANWLITPIYCEGAAEALRRKYAIAGELSPMGCTVKSRRAVMGLAKSFRDAGSGGSGVILSKRPADDAGG